MTKALQIKAADNVAVALRDLNAGEQVLGVTLPQNIAAGHKFALHNIIAGSNILKYAQPIGYANVNIKAGEWVHTHNLSTNLGERLEYNYEPQPVAPMPPTSERSFQGYRRTDGQVGIRNQLWIIPTVGCVNRTAENIAAALNRNNTGRDNFDGAIALTHPYGCSQLGADHVRTRKILAAMAHHPNAGGVLIVGLGCENNTIVEFKEALGELAHLNIAFLVAQEVCDELVTGVELGQQLINNFVGCERSCCSASQLTIGLKCGGSDAFSGITANPLVGAVSDLHLALGGATVLTEVPEMFGAEQLLMSRAQNSTVFEQTVNLINNFKAYYEAHNQPIYENPSPGNKAGGISTLEEKSLGCVQKGGMGTVSAVLDYGEHVRTAGLNLLNGPGNDIVACTALMAAGCHLILFTTGRGTPLGTVVPTFKIATNSSIFEHKANWFDYNAGRLLTGQTMDKLAEELYTKILRVADGEICQAEKSGSREIAIFKTGVTL